MLHRDLLVRVVGVWTRTSHVTVGSDRNGRRRTLSETIVGSIECLGALRAVSLGVGGERVCRARAVSW